MMLGIFARIDAAERPSHQRGGIAGAVDDPLDARVDAVDDVGGMAATGAGLAPEPGDSGQPGPIVRPTVVDDFEDDSAEIDMEADMASAVEQPVAEHDLLTADQIDENNFDPRIR